MTQVVVIGANGGIGSEFIRQLRKVYPNKVIATYNRLAPETNYADVDYRTLDITHEEKIRTFCESLERVTLFINAVGFLHNTQYSPEKTIKQASTDYFMESMRINALPTLLFARYLAPNLRHDKQAVFATVSARVGSIEENYLGGWFSYRASKAALNQVLKTLSIEWQRSMKNVCVAALHPGTTDTSLSKPFQRNLPEGQLQTTEYSVESMLKIIENLTPKETGRFWSFDGEQLPW